MRSKIFIICFYFALASICLAEISGKVIDQQGLPLNGVVVYDISNTCFSVLNNQSALVEHLPRSLTDKTGQFTLNSKAGDNVILIAKDLRDRFSVYEQSGPIAGPITVTMEDSAELKGILMAGPDPVTDTEITLASTLYCEHLKYSINAKTNQKGEFRFQNVMPGTYSLAVLQDIPAIGCMGKVPTKYKKIELEPGGTRNIRFGGTDLPYLTGTVTTLLDEPLHGVWVQLVSQIPDPNTETQIWADVTDPNGFYCIYDIPPGNYNVQCLRRLAKNTPTRAMEKNLSINIKEGSVTEPEKEKRNILDISMNSEPMLPLQIGHAAPDIQTLTCEGKLWSLQGSRGKVVVIHFYKATSEYCRANFDGFEKTQTRFGSNVEVVGISLDKTKKDFVDMINKKKPTHQQIYEGPGSQIAKDYRITDVPSCIVVTQDGTVAQFDLFGATLEKFIRNKLL